VVRFREAGGSLGEMAIVIDDLPGEPAAPVVRIGPDGKLYVGTSALDDDDARDLASYAGKILRLNLDGTTPADNPVASSPVYASGFRDLRGIGWSEAGALWHAGGDGARGWLGHAAAGRRGERIIEIGSSTLSGPAFYTGAAVSEWRGSLFVPLPDEQSILRVSGLSASPPIPALERLFQGEFGRIAVVLEADDGLYFSTSNGATASDAPAADAVYRVRDRQRAR
jgi:glucose/arabinose dehydrogenase